MDGRDALLFAGVFREEYSSALIKVSPTRSLL